MKFTVISAQKFRAYADKSPYKNFMQTPELASARAQIGWQAHYVAVIAEKADEKSAENGQKSANLAENPAKSAQKSAKINQKTVKIAQKSAEIGKFSSKMVKNDQKSAKISNFSPKTAKISPESANLAEKSAKIAKNDQKAQNSRNFPKSAVFAPKSVQSGEILGACLLFSRPAFLKYRTFFAPGGPLLDLTNTPLVDFFFAELKKFLRSRHAFELIITPYQELIQRDLDGKAVRGGFDYTDAKKHLLALGFTTTTTSQPTYLFVRDLAVDAPDNAGVIESVAENDTKNAKNVAKPAKNTVKTSVIKLISEDALLASFKANTRNKISKALRSGIKIEELSRAELPRFLAIVSATADRRGFADRGLDYYRRMHDAFAPKGQAHFLLASLDLAASQKNLQDSQKNLQKELLEVEKEITGLEKLQNPDGHARKQLKRAKNRHKALSLQCKNTDANLVETEALIAQLRKKSAPPVIDLSAALFITYGDEVIYLMSGSATAYIRFDAPYLLQWQMFRYALAHGTSRYNFYGILGLPDSSAPDYGVYLFKRGFRGHVVEQYGSFRLTVNRPVSALHSALAGLKHWVKKGLKK